MNLHYLSCIIVYISMYTSLNNFDKKLLKYNKIMKILNIFIFDLRLKNLKSWDEKNRFIKCI